MDSLESKMSKVAGFVAGLRAVADWYEQHPEIDLPSPVLRVCSFSSEETPELTASIARTLGTFKKDYSDELLTLKKSFGDVTLQFLFYRTAVCTKRVVKTVVEEVEIPDPEAPKVTITREREIIEWDCPPLLAHEIAEAS